LKWAGGKRWLVDRAEFQIPAYTGRYIEPFLGGGAVFFSHRPKRAILSDANSRLIETYQALRDDWRTVVRILGKHHKRHCKEYYYEQRDATPAKPASRAAQFIYLNRACWNGLYRVNKMGQFNVPVGTKNWVLSEADEFDLTALALADATLVCCDFEETIAMAEGGDLIFADPPYTVAHNFNGFVKYNDKIFSWQDQVRLKDALVAARNRGVTVILTNASHDSVHELYRSHARLSRVARQSVISGAAKGRAGTEEALYFFE
jgi:DNA adenine methylase